MCDGINDNIKFESDAVTAPVELTGKVNSKGRISPKDPVFYEEQMTLLESEGIEFGIKDQIDFKKYFWNIKSIQDIK